MVAALAATVGSCGIKGPLTPPPAPDAAKAPAEVTKPAARDSSVPPKL
jgi:predicted small lipoprotein YifL